MTEEKMTTVQIDLETARKLKLIAAVHERSKSAQLRFWVNREYTELRNLNMLPSSDQEELK